MQYIHNQSNISEAFDFEQLDANDIISQPSNFAIYSITPYIVSLLTEFLSATEIKCLNPVKGITEFYPDIIPGMPAAVVKSNVVLYTGFSCSRGDYYIQLEDIKCFNVFKTCGTIVSDEEILDKLRLEFNHIFMSPTLQRQYLDAYKVYQRITENISIDTIIKLYNAYIPSKYRFSTTFILSHDCISYKVGYNNNDIMCECVPNLPEEYLALDDTASVIIGLTGANIPDICKTSYNTITEAFDFNEVEDSLSDSPYDSMYVKKVYSSTLDIRPVLPAVFNLKDITGATVYRPEELGEFPALIKPMGTAHSTISKAIDSIARTNNGWFCVLGLYYQAHEYLNNHPDATLEELINLYSSLQFKGMYIASGFKSDLENILDTYKKITAITNGDYEFILNILKEYSCNVDLPENKHQHIRAISRLCISPDCSIYYFYADGYSTRADLRNGKYYLMCIGLTGHNIPEYCHAQPKKKVSRVKEAHEVTVLKRMMAKATISAASIADVEYGIFSDGRPYCVITGEKYYKSFGCCKMANAAKDKIRYNMASIYSRGMD